MKFFQLLLISFFTSISWHSQVQAQESGSATTTAEAAEEVQSALTNRLQNALRSTSTPENPSNGTEAIREGANQAIQAADRAFQEALRKSRSGESLTTTPALSAPELEQKAQNALQQVGEMIPALSDPAAIPPPTRAAATEAAKKASQLLQEATGSTGSVITNILDQPALAPNNGVVAKGAPAQPVAEAMPALGSQSLLAPVVSSDAPSLDGGNIPAPKPLAPKHGGGSQLRATVPAGHMEITSRQTEMNQKSNTIIFSGDVFVDNPDENFTIKCDKLTLYLTPEGQELTDVEGEKTRLKRAVASGGMVEVQRTVPSKEPGKIKTQTALARSVDYDAVTKDVVLSGGPPYLEDGGTKIETRSHSAKMILKANGSYTKIDDAGRTTITVPIKNGKKLSQDVGTSQGLGF